MSLPLFRVAIVLVCCLGASAQTPSPAPASGAIAGIVTDSNKAPIRRAIVTLSTIETHPQDAVAWTDANGRFAFGYLPAGRYELRVTKNGYQNTAYGSEQPRRPPSAIQLGAGEVRGDFVFHLQQVTTILGLVVDEDGDPVRGIQVTAIRWGWQHQKRRLIAGASGISDGAGHYRLTGLPPGRYVIAAIPPGFRQPFRVQPEAVAGQTPPQESFALQYYPGSDRAESATQISVEPGHEYSQIDFHLTAQRNPSLDGKVVPPSDVANLEHTNVTVFRKDASNGLMSTGARFSPSNLVFSVNQVQPGSYTLVAQATAEGKPYRGVLSVEVGSQDLHDLAILMQPSIDLSGTVSVEGPDAARFSASFVNLVSGDDIPYNGPQLHGNVAKDGSFKISGVFPGVWDINAGPVPPGGYIKSMRLGDQDVLTEEMVIQPSTQAPLKIVIGTQAATVRGEVTSNGQPARAVVLLAPESRLRHVLSFYRYFSADTSGHFEIKGAAPGTYQLFALDEFDPQSIPDPDFQKTLESGGVTVTLHEGENTAPKLSLGSTGNAHLEPGVAQ